MSSLPLLEDADIILSNLDATLFPGISSSVEVHSGFAGGQARSDLSFKPSQNVIDMSFLYTQHCAANIVCSSNCDLRIWGQACYSGRAFARWDSDMNLRSTQFLNSYDRGCTRSSGRGISTSPSSWS